MRISESSKSGTRFVPFFWNYVEDDFSVAIRAILLKIPHRSDLLLDLVGVGSNADLDLLKMGFQRKITSGSQLNLTIALVTRTDDILPASEFLDD